MSGAEIVSWVLQPHVVGAVAAVLSVGVVVAVVEVPRALERRASRSGRRRADPFVLGLVTAFPALALAVATALMASGTDLAQFAYLVTIVQVCGGGALAAQIMAYLQENRELRAGRPGPDAPGPDPGPAGAAHAPGGGAAAGAGARPPTTIDLDRAATRRDEAPDTPGTP